MKKYNSYILIFLLGCVCNLSAQSLIEKSDEQKHESEDIKDELLYLYNHEPQLCKPSFSSTAHRLIELQKISSHGIWSWILEYLNSYVDQPYFRVLPEKAPRTMAYLKFIAKKMGLPRIPDLYLSQNNWDPYNAFAGSTFLQNTAPWFHYVINSSINYAIVTKAEDEWKFPLLALRYMVPAVGAMLLKKYINPTDRIVICDRKMIEHFSENDIRAVLAHESAHIKHSDHEIHNIITNVNMCIAYASVYYVLTHNMSQPYLSALSPDMYTTLNSVTNNFNINLLRGYNEKDLTKQLIPNLVANVCAEYLEGILNAAQSRSIEYRADLEAAYIVGFENMILHQEKMLAFLEPDAERDFALVQPSNNSLINLWTWLLKLSEKFKEWKKLNSPFRSHPTDQQRIDYLKNMQPKNC